MVLPDSQRYLWNLYLINNVEDVVFVFKIIYGMIIPKGSSYRETTIENNYFLKL